MKFKKLICLLLCIIISINFLVGCDSKDDYVLYFELDSTPKTLDPQLANGTSEELLVKNLFEGLMRENSKGEIVKGVAKEYTVSSDGKTYTFTIRDGAQWSDDVDVKAQDFVFAFERAVNPKNKAPYVASLYGITGAKEIAQGAQTGGLGITAPNDNTVIINLTAPDPEFLRTLTTAICMPCRKDIYNKAKGQYGIVADRLVTNGSYKLRFWEKTEKFSLRINKFADYNGDFQAEAKAVIFNVGNIDGRAVRIDEGNVDMGFINLSESSDKSNLFSYEKSNYALIINKNSIFGTDTFKKAFTKSIHRNRLKNELGKSLNESSCIIPNTILLNGTPLSSQITAPKVLDYDPTEAYSLYIEAAKSTKELPSKIDILYFGDQEITDLAQLVAENMQQALGAVVNASPTDTETTLLNRVANGEYTLAIIPITAKSSSPAQFFEAFTKNSSNNIYGFANNEYDNYVSKIVSNASTSTILSASETALKELISTQSVIPLAMHLEAFSYGKEFTCPTISPFAGVIDLSLVRKIG
jgi:oligopeptide transport system substrate-binding protein